MTIEDAASLRRRMDQALAENARQDWVQICEMLERLARMESVIQHLGDEARTARQQTLAVQVAQNSIIEKLTEFSARFVAHVEDEAQERSLFQTLADRVSAHAARITGLERLFWALAGASGTVALAAVGWALELLKTLKP